MSSATMAATRGRGAVAVSALEALEREQDRPGATTFCRRIDELFPGLRGIPTGKVTEVCGMAGIGKTQLCMQLCATVQIPASVGGLGGSALYIDTEGSFSPARLQEIAKATVDLLNSSVSEGEEAMDLRQVMSNVSILRVFSQQEQAETISDLDNYIRAHPGIRLIILDSIALHFRHSFRDLAMRSRVLTGMAQTLRQVAEVHDIAIVVTNQMTTKIVAKGTDEESALMVPALGESWSHACTNRVILLWHKGGRHAWLCKSPNAEDALVPFEITTDGIRDVEF
ncbi:Rad51C protein [Entophlyctis helioformis]|nr:Rad51C protein [Entophlyctis helioformis]